MLANTVIDMTITAHENDPITLGQEEYLRRVIDRARSVRELAQRHTEGALSAVIIQTAQVWKDDLAKKAIKMYQDGFNFKQGGSKFLQTQPYFRDESTKGEVMQFWKIVVSGQKKRRGRIYTWGEQENNLVQTGFDEVAFLSANAEFISGALEIGSVEVYRAGEGEDVAGKSRSSLPLEPGIAWR